jgi:hypothetical protein
VIKSSFELAVGIRFEPPFANLRFRYMELWLRWRVVFWMFYRLSIRRRWGWETGMREWLETAVWELRRVAGVPVGAPSASVRIPAPKIVGFPFIHFLHSSAGNFSSRAVDLSYNTCGLARYLNKPNGRYLIAI